MMVVAAAAGDGKLPLALLGERPLSAARTLSEVPVVLIPSTDIALFSNVHISAVSRSQPVVTCSLDSYSLEATPAVRVVLRRPVIVQSPEAALPFPASLSVLHEGLRMSIPVGALLAPISGVAPHVIRVMYAVPTSPLSLQYPYYAPFHYPIRPNYGELSTYVSPLPQAPIRPASIFTAQTISQSDIDNLIGSKKPSSRPFVTVLQFPEEIATPESLYYQPPVEDELGNRNPPEAVIPAGIVQSAQPKPHLQLFINSKESPLLQALRDESETKKDEPSEKTASPNSISVEALK